METNKKLYLGVNGIYYDEYEIARAYFLVTGDNVWIDEFGTTTKKFDIWVHDLIGLSIKKIVNFEDVPYEDFMNAGQKIMAVKAYRERNNCSLREAKDAIDKIQEELEAK